MVKIYWITKCTTTGYCDPFDLQKYTHILYGDSTNIHLR